MSKSSTKEPRIFNDAIIYIYDLYKKKASLEDISEITNITKKELAKTLVHHCHKLSVRESSESDLFVELMTMRNKLINYLFKEKLMMPEDISKTSNISRSEIRTIVDYY
jgi:hypothetical protein